MRGERVLVIEIGNKGCRIVDVDDESGGLMTPS